MDMSAYTELQKRLHYEFKDKKLLILSLTHKSFMNETHLVKNTSVDSNNERYEFLGDAILDFVMSDMLMEFFPQDTEGSLSKKRASLVNEDVLSQVAQRLELHKVIRLGKGEDQQGGRQKPRLLASAFEALIGAVYKDSNFIEVEVVLRRIFADLVLGSQTKYEYESDYKTRFQEFTQKHYKKAPVYSVLKETGPSHEPFFQVEVYVDENKKYMGLGKSKKIAEQNAAQVALVALDRLTEEMPEKVVTKKSKVIKKNIETVYKKKSRGKV